ncbi:MAG: hypothetical protein WC459_01125 [Patescibacteria group bacterium]
MLDQEFLQRREQQNIEAEKFLKTQSARELWKGRGKEFERFVLGEINPDETFFKEEERIMGSDASFGKKLTGRQKNELFSLVERYNQLQPGTEYAKALLEAVSEAIGIDPQDKTKRVNFCTTLIKSGDRVSAVDFKLGTDGFFVYEDSGKKYYVQLDATTNPDSSAKEIVNADIIIAPENIPDKKRMPGEYAFQVEAMAMKINRVIQDKIDRGDFVQKSGESRSDVSLVTAARGRNIREYTPPPKNISKGKKR